MERKNEALEDVFLFKQVIFQFHVSSEDGYSKVHLHNLRRFSPNIKVTGTPSKTNPHNPTKSCGKFHKQIILKLYYIFFV